MLISDRVLANYDPIKVTKVYADDDPAGGAGAVAQLHKVEKV